MEKGNLYVLPDRRQGSEELLEVLACGAGARIERIISDGQVTPPGAWYDQDLEEWVTLLEGKATLLFEEGPTVHLARGDWLRIPPHARHRVEETSVSPPCVWLVVHFEAPAKEQ